MKNNFGYEQMSHMLNGFKKLVKCKNLENMVVNSEFCTAVRSIVLYGSDNELENPFIDNENGNTVVVDDDKDLANLWYFLVHARNMESAYNYAIQLCEIVTENPFEKEEEHKEKFFSVTKYANTGDFDGDEDVSSHVEDVMDTHKEKENGFTVVDDRFKNFFNKLFNKR